MSPARVDTLMNDNKLDSSLESIGENIKESLNFDKNKMRSIAAEYLKIGSKPTLYQRDSKKSSKMKSKKIIVTNEESKRQGKTSQPVSRASN